MLPLLHSFSCKEIYIHFFTKILLLEQRQQKGYIIFFNIFYNNKIYRLVYSAKNMQNRYSLTRGVLRHTVCLAFVDKIEHTHI